MEVFFFQIKIDQNQFFFINNIFDLTITIDMTMLTTMRESICQQSQERNSNN
jgi:hypothetical protein